MTRKYNISGNSYTTSDVSIMRCTKAAFRPKSMHVRRCILIHAHICTKVGEETIQQASEPTAKHITGAPHRSGRSLRREPERIENSTLIGQTGATT
eukprot:2818429-Pyramimonas_sp.AAC.1